MSDDSQRKDYVIPITLPFSEKEAVAMLRAVGYREFAVEAVKRTQVLCTTAPGGRRITVEEAMRAEVAAALKKLLTTEDSPLQLPATGETSETEEPRIGLPEEVLRWALMAATEYERILQILYEPRWRRVFDRGGSLYPEEESVLREAGSLGYVSLRTVRGQLSPSLTPAAVAACERLRVLTLAVGRVPDGLFALQVLHRGETDEHLPRPTLRRLSAWGLIQSLTSPRLTCVGRAVLSLAQQSQGSR